MFMKYSAIKTCFPRESPPLFHHTPVFTYVHLAQRMVQYIISLKRLQTFILRRIVHKSRHTTYPAKNIGRIIVKY